jgi:hypothetical protein
MRESAKCQSVVLGSPPGHGYLSVEVCAAECPCDKQDCEQNRCSSRSEADHHNLVQPSTENSAERDSEQRDRNEEEEEGDGVRELRYVEADCVEPPDEAVDSRRATKHCEDHESVSRLEFCRHGCLATHALRRIRTLAMSLRSPLGISAAAKATSGGERFQLAYVNTL